MPRMATEFSMLSIMNAALLAQGQHDINENDGSLEWRTLFRNWPLIVEAELEDGEYNFTKTEHMSVTSIAGKFGYEAGYLIPGDTLAVRRVWVRVDGVTEVTKIPIDWISDGSYVYVNHPGSGYTDGVYIETTEAADEHIWGANFARGVQLKMEAVVAKSIKEEFSESQNLDGQAELHFDRARTRSSKQRSPQPAYKKGPLSRARRTRR